MTREEAIKTIRMCCPKVGDSQCDFESALRELIPELAEGEDEKIRREILEYLNQYKDSGLRGIDITPWIAYIEKQKDASKAIEAVDRIDKYIDEQVANAHDMKDSNPDKKYYQGWDDALGEIAGILQDVYSGEKQKEQKHYWKPTETDVALFNKAVTTNKALTPAERAQLDIIRSKFGCCRAVNCSGIVQKEQKPMNNPKWNELTWKDINELEEIINHVHYEFRNGISAEGFGKEVLEQFRNMKEDAEVDACEQKPSMIQWKGDNLKEVIDFTGKSPMFNKWFKSFEEYEEYVHSHGNIFKLFNDDGSHYEVPVGAWIVKTPDGYNVASKAVFRKKPAEWSFPYGKDETVDKLIAIAGCLEMDGDCLFNGYTGTECGKFLRELARKQIECKPVGWSEEDDGMLLSIINDFRNGTVSTIGKEQWLKWLPERFNLQPKPEWSEEDETKLRDVVRLVEDSGHVKSIREHYKKFLMSLPERFNLCPEHGKCRTA